MLNSKDVLEKTGISRATLNNYISWGIVAKPQVLPPGPQDGAAPRIGYFPDGVVERITDVQRLKSQGWSMTRIAEHFGAVPTPAAAAARSAHAPAPAAILPASSEPRPGAMPRLSIDEPVEPAYLVNRSFELVWLNAAASSLLGDIAQVPPQAGSRSIFISLLHGQSPGPQAREEILRFHLGLAKQRGATFADLCRDVPREEMALMERLYGEAKRPEPGLVAEISVLTGGPGVGQAVSLYAVQVREGVLFVYAPRRASAEAPAAPLAGPDRLLDQLVRKRLPVLTPVAVLVMDLEHASQIWAELPAEEYFELVNQIWSTVDPIFRRHQGMHGKHAGDGLSGYFFPRPGGSHVWDALAAAHETREAMRRVSKEWKVRKGWATELYMNIGIDEGHEWLGSFKSASQADFTALAATINNAARISEFARCGGIWATKNLLGKLTGGERQRLTYGVHRHNKDGQTVFVSSVFSSVDGLADLAAGAFGRLSDIARLPITEIVDISADGEAADPRVGQRQT